MKNKLPKTEINIKGKNLIFQKNKNINQHQLEKLLIKI